MIDFKVLTLDPHGHCVGVDNFGGSRLHGNSLLEKVVSERAGFVTNRQAQGVVVDGVAASRLRYGISNLLDCFW